MEIEKGYPLDSILKELNLKALIHFGNNHDVVSKAGDEEMYNALIKSNLISVLESEIAMPIRLVNNEIYEMVMKNSRGIVAKEGRINRYLVALKMDINNIIAAVGDDLDPGMILFELMQFYHKR
ncbi:MAG: hypothetical protein ACTSR2_00745 [Candidatus Hodarchaeales archaeon]